jgi:AraC family transcriptional regulator
MDSERNRSEYLGRVHRVQDHIERNLAGDLRLEDLARVACFSPFHFHRVFAAVTGETLYQYILRVRLARAASQLLQNPRKSITAIALDTGFGGSAAFARAFHASFGVSATTWRKQGGQAVPRIRKNRKALGNRSKESSATASYGGSIDTRTASAANDGVDERPMTMQLSTSTQPAKNVVVQECPAFTVAYVRHVGPYAGDAALFGRLFEQLTRWAGPRGLLSRPDVRMLTIYHDPPSITDENKLRISVCVSAPPDTRADGEIGVMEIPAGKYAAARYELGPDEYGAAWSWVFGTWLPSSGYQPGDGPSYELYHAMPESCEEKIVLDIVVPVIPL